MHPLLSTPEYVKEDVKRYSASAMRYAEWLFEKSKGVIDSHTCSGPCKPMSLFCSLLGPKQGRIYRAYQIHQVRNAFCLWQEPLILRTGSRQFGPLLERCSRRWIR